MARAMWSGSISFGLVTVPVKLYTAVRDKDVKFHMLDRQNHCRVRRKLVCENGEKEIGYEDTVKGYEIQPDQYVVIEPDELEALKPDSDRSIDITDFVDLPQIDPLYYDHPYYLLPDKRGGKAYNLLVEVMREENKVGIAHFVMHGKQYLAALRPIKNVLCVETMRYDDEVVKTDELPDVPEQVKLDPREVKMARQLVNALVTEFDPKQYKDEYREKVLELIERKARGEKITKPKSAGPKKHVINLMEALQASLETAKKEGAGRKTTVAADISATKARTTRRKVSA